MVKIKNVPYNYLFLFSFIKIEIYLIYLSISKNHIIPEKGKFSARNLSFQIFRVPPKSKNKVINAWKQIKLGIGMQKTLNK